MRGAGLIAALVLALPGVALAQAENANPGDRSADAVLPAPEMPTPGIPSATDDLPARVIAQPEVSGPPVSAILTIDQNRLYSESAWGRRAQSLLEAEGRKIVAENERLTQLLSSEEAALTKQRATLPPDEFRRLADAFDQRATRIRRERAQAVQALNDWADADRDAFVRAALPHMGDLMSERGAVAVLDYRMVFVSLDAIDITEALTERLDREIGDGAGAVPLPEAAP